MNIQSNPWLSGHLYWAASDQKSRWEPFLGFYLYQAATIPFPKGGCLISVKLYTIFQILRYLQDRIDWQRHTKGKARPKHFSWFTREPSSPYANPLHSRFIISSKFCGLWRLFINYSLLTFLFLCFLAAISLTMAVSKQKALTNLATTHIQISFSYGPKFLTFYYFHLL